jgi:hypothetical protein
MFSRLVQIIPSECEVSNSADKSRVCYLPQNWNESLELPVITFSMNMDEGKLLYLPLEMLLLEPKISVKNGPLRRRWCISELSSMTKSSLANDGFQKITLGFHALKPFYSILDWSESRAGLVQIDQSLSKRNLTSSCKLTSLVCNKKYTFDYLTNSCTKPECSMYLYEIDDSGTCTLVKISFLSHSNFFFFFFAR